MLKGSYWQIGGPEGITVNELVRALKDQGFGATHIAAGRAIGWQVVVIAGPYADETSLMQAKVTLEMAGFRVLRRF